MVGFIKKTLGGLSPQYYFRQLFFGALLALFCIMIEYDGAARSARPVNFNMIVLFAFNALLYPYSRFLYETIVSFFMGDTILIMNAILMLIIKLITMMICWSFAIFFAPVGLIYLYIHHTVSSKRQDF